MAKYFAGGHLRFQDGEWRDDSGNIVDVVEVQHGEWFVELDDLGWNKYTCSACGYTKRTDIHTSLGWNYCPGCGAKMDGGTYG